MGLDSMTKRILFRADAKPSIGTGDLVSLIHLSRYFEKSGWETHFIVRSHDAAAGIIKARKIRNCLMINDNLSIGMEIEEINNYISSRKIDVVFFEITERPLTEYKGITDKAVKACINFDGLIPDDMSLVVCWDVNADKLFDRKRYPKTKFLLGPRYAILPHDFNFAKIYSRSYKSKPEVLLVSMGGADELNFTQQIVDALIKKKTVLKLNVIVGWGYRHIKRLNESLGGSGVEYEIEQNLTNMFDEFMNCDVAVSAGGLTSFELVATRTPSVLIAIHEHQIGRCEYFDKMGWGKYLGFGSFDEEALLDGILNPVTHLPKAVFKTEEIRDHIDGLFQRH